MLNEVVEKKNEPLSLCFGRESVRKFFSKNEREMMCHLASNPGFVN